MPSNQGVLDCVAGRNAVKGCHGRFAMHPPNLARLAASHAALVACLPFVASLMVFPNAVPWLIAAWLLGYTVLLLAGTASGDGVLGGLRDRVVNQTLDACARLVGAARSDARRFRAGRRSFWERRGGVITTIRLAEHYRLVDCLGTMAWDWFAAMHCRHPLALKDNRPVVCIGDSMTSLGMFGGYPDDLRKLVTLPVVNQGHRRRFGGAVCHRAFAAALRGTIRRLW